jgi:quercetin dioxygenase-like cupin family protein
MPFTCTPKAFDVEAEAVREIEARGWHALTFPAPGEVSEWHWHDFEALIFMLEGTLRIEFEDGSESFVCEPGTRVETADHVVHREITDGYRAVFGISVDPAQITLPINKPVEQLV